MIEWDIRVESSGVECQDRAAILEIGQSHVTSSRMARVAFREAVKRPKPLLAISKPSGPLLTKLARLFSGARPFGKSIL